EDEAFEKVRSGFKADLGHPCSQSVVKWREAGLLQPLDTSKIMGWKDLNPGIMAMKDLATTADGKAWFMPWDWGDTQLTYNSEKIDEKDVHKNVRSYWTDTTDIVQLLSGGEVDLAWAWNDAAVQSQAAGVPIKSRKDTEEGMSTWVCGYVLFKDAPGNVDKAYDYLNAVNDPSVANILVKDWGYGQANAKGMAGVDQAVLKEKGYDNVEKWVDKTLFQQPLPSELKLKMIAEFEKIKAGY
ncbi:MAG: polyamine ABC transporter substrate-binding protein, partial [Mesorhizobium sp.]